MFKNSGIKGGLVPWKVRDSLPDFLNVSDNHALSEPIKIWRSINPAHFGFSVTPTPQMLPFDDLPDIPGF
jgi:hypothetical protein